MSQKILIVEDDPVTAKWLRQIIEAEGYEVLESSDGKKGLENFKRSPDICLIFCDYKMPVMDGKSFVKKLHKLFGKKEVPIILISGEMSFKEYNYLLRYGAKGFMEKPLFGSDIQNVLQQFAPREIEKETVN